MKIREETSRTVKSSYNRWDDDQKSRISSAFLPIRTGENAHSDEVIEKYLDFC